MRYWRINDSFPAGRWHLNDPETFDGIKIDSRLFTEGKRFFGQTIYPDHTTSEDSIVNRTQYGSDHPIQFRIRKGENPINFIFGPFEIPVIAGNIAEQLEACCSQSIQLIPARIFDVESSFEILNVVNVIDAIDETHSEITWRTRKDKQGNVTRTYAGIMKLVLAQSKIQNASIFRLKEWEMALIVSDRIKEILETLHATGVDFEELEVT